MPPGPPPHLEVRFQSPLLEKKRKDYFPTRMWKSVFRVKHPPPPLLKKGKIFSGLHLGSGNTPRPLLEKKKILFSG